MHILTPRPGTGTTTGGENWVGYLTTAQNASLVLSYNLAVGGASIDNSLVQGSTDVDLASQVDIFDETYSSKPASAPWSAENSVFGFWIGINEYVVLCSGETRLKLAPYSLLSSVSEMHFTTPMPILSRRS